MIPCELIADPVLVFLMTFSAGSELNVHDSDSWDAKFGTHAVRVVVIVRNMMLCQLGRSNTALFSLLK